MKKSFIFFKHLFMEKALCLFLFLSLFISIFRLKVSYEREFLNKIRFILLVNLALFSFSSLAVNSESKPSPSSTSSKELKFKKGELQAVIAKKGNEDKAQNLEKTETIQIPEENPKRKFIENPEELNLLENLKTEEVVATEDLSSIDFFWKAAFQIQNFNDETTTNGVISTKIYGDLKWKLTDQFSFQGQALLIGRNGFTQSIFNRENRARGFYLLESFLQWRYRKDSPFSLQFGHIEQSFLQAPLLMTDWTFFSFIFNYSLKEFYHFKPSLLIQASVPDNAEESVQRESQIIEGFPLFSVLSFYLENSKLPLLLKHDFFNRSTFFLYYNLSQAVAERSRRYENTIEYTGSNSDFRYDYYGFHNHSNFKIVLSHFLAGEVGLEYLANLGAPYHLREGYRLYTGFSYNYKNFLEWKTIVEQFMNQSDSSVAYYNSEFYGHNARKGFAVKLECYFYDSGLRLGASVVRSNPIDKEDPLAIGPSTAISVFLTTNQIKI